jgi:UDP-3-O-[3-hydroxymyristoyl] N-acetylglucosamine deacetylase
MIEQRTLSRKIKVSGVGLHSGLYVNMTLHPANVDHGIRFRRTDMIGPTADIFASVDCVSSLERATTLSNDAKHSVSTVEHLVAACRGLGIDNILIELDGPEVPIMDGSSLDFCNLFKSSGFVGQSKPRNLIRILKPVEVREGESFASLEPTDRNVLSLSAQIAFKEAAIGTQKRSLVLDQGVFCKELSFARTFGLSCELESLHARGLALGGSLDNAILIDGDRIVNQGGLRSADEFVLHKLLDAIGDLALAGGAIAGHYEAVQPGHRLNIDLVKSLMETPDAWCWEQQEADLGLPVVPEVLSDVETVLPAPPV